MQSKIFTPMKILLIVFLVTTVILPLLQMMTYVTHSDASAILNSPRLWRAAKNSAAVSSAASMVSISAALLAAFCVARSGIRYKRVFDMFATLPMLIPSISHGMGLIVLFGRNGILTNMFSIEGSVYGFWGIVAGSVFYSFPLAYLMLRDILEYEDTSPYEAATILGISRLRQFVSITLPYLYKPLTAVAFATFTMIVTDYGVPLIVGGRFLTLPVMMYEEVIGMLNFGGGSVIGAMLLVPAVVSFVLDSFSRDMGNQSYVTLKWKQKPSDAVVTLAYAYCIFIIVIAVLPVASFFLLAFVNKYPHDMTFTLKNALNSFRKGADTYLVNSLFIALSVTAWGVFFSYLTAYFTSRSAGSSSRALHLASITSLAVPGIVLGISYVLFFKGTFLYSTLSILMLVNLAHFFASPYLMAYNSLNKVNRNLEAVGMTLGISRWRILRDVIVPMTLPTILEMGSYFFVNSMMTISAVAFLSNVRTKPLSMMIPAFEANMQLECAAFVSLLILLSNVAMKLLAGAFRRILGRE
ncbi:MAG: ABC transporter permease subunit [Synergistaceae bacterium]|jgi:iron(III) transport system permease protein|nr:ABC transporter permease subunit [Synergistaceae bacterium]